MTADKRSVATDALATLGNKITENEKRDAIHLAVEPVTAAEKLWPGDDIGFVEGGVGACPNPIGIVDPFIKGAVQKGDMFWLIVYPRQITSLRHVWMHPAFPPEKELIGPDLSTVAETSRRWIEEFAAAIPLAYGVIMDGADNWIASREKGGYGEYLCFGGLLEGESVPDEFWSHYQNVTGKPVNPEFRESFFTCSC